MIAPPKVITCIDCGGRAFLLTPEPEDGLWEIGDSIAYRCEDCLDRWDLVIDENDIDHDGRPDT